MLRRVRPLRTLCWIGGDFPEKKVQSVVDFLWGPEERPFFASKRALMRWTLRSLSRPYESHDRDPRLRRIAAREGIGRSDPSVN